MHILSLLSGICEQIFPAAEVSPVRVIAIVCRPALDEPKPKQGFEHSKPGRDNTSQRRSPIPLPPSPLPSPTTAAASRKAAAAKTTAKAPPAKSTAKQGRFDAQIKIDPKKAKVVGQIHKKAKVAGQFHKWLINNRGGSCRGQYIAPIVCCGRHRSPVKTL